MGMPLLIADPFDLRVRSDEECGRNCATMDQSTQPHTANFEGGTTPRSFIHPTAGSGLGGVLTKGARYILIQEGVKQTSNNVPYANAADREFFERVRYVPSYRSCC